MAQARPMAYASEVGESFRPLVHPMFVRFLYGLSWGYVFLDSAVRTYTVRKYGREAMGYCFLDASIFHTFASMALPAFTIHSIVKYSGKFLKKTLPNSRVSKFGPVVLGLGSIPFIIHPLDHFTEFVMDRTVRKLYQGKFPNLHHDKH
jgi:fission process protein 1